MGWSNSDLPWSEFERRLSGRVVADPLAIDYGDGSDTPEWMRSRPRYTPRATDQRPSIVDYAELHCHTNFSFLDGASQPEDLAEEAYRLGLTALGIFMAARMTSSIVPPPITRSTS